MIKLCRILDKLERRSCWLLGIGLFIVISINTWLAARDRKQLRRFSIRNHGPKPPDLKSPLVSILLPAWNESLNIELCLRSLLDLRYPNLEVIVSAGGTDRTFDLARKYVGEKVVVLEQLPGQGKQGALRQCFQFASGELIFLTDADCIVEDKVFKRVINPILSGQELATTGAWQPIDQQLNNAFVQYQWAQHIYRELWMPDYAPALDGRIAAIHRDALEDVGAFEIDAPIGTDLTLSKQLEAGGYRIRFVRECLIQTRYPQTIHSYLKQASRWFRNPVIVGWQWRDRKLALDIVQDGVTSLSLLLAPLLIALSRRKIFIVVWILAIAHLWLSANRVMTAAKLSGRSRIDKISQLPVFIIVNWMGMAKGLLDLVVHQKRSAW